MSGYESNAFAAFGTILGVETSGSPGVYTNIVEVRDIEGPSLSTNTSEVTHHESLGAFEEHVGTTISPGDVTFIVGYLPTAVTHDETDGLLSMLVDRERHAFQLLFPDTSTWQFDAIVSGFNPKAPVKGDLTAELKLKVSGQPTFTPAA